ncbi:ankyrin, partial [Cadophora sp. DSE1049]
MKGQLHIVRLLLDAGANVNIQGGYYGTPLQAAAYQGHKEVVSLLVGAAADPQQSGFSKDAIHAAAEGGRHHIIELLLALDYVPYTVDLFVEACVGGHEAIVKAGVKQRIPPSVVDSKGRPALHFAAIHGSAAVVELLLRSGADPN